MRLSHPEDAMRRSVSGGKPKLNSFFDGKGRPLSLSHTLWAASASAKSKQLSSSFATLSPYNNKCAPSANANFSGF